MPSQVNPQNSEKRQCERYDKEVKLCYDFPYGFPYDAAAKLKIQVENQSQQPKRYAGVSKNVCATGLCLTSHHLLEKGQHLHLEIFLPQGHQPIQMDGEVCWCDRSSLSTAKRELFMAGVKLQSVEGQSVAESVHLDEVHHVIWSNVLEAVFGTFRKLMQEKQGKMI